MIIIILVITSKQANLIYIVNVTDLFLKTCQFNMAKVIGKITVSEAEGIG